MVIVLFLFGLPALAYAVLWLAAWRRHGRPEPSGQWAQWTLLLALALHAGSLFWPWGDHAFRFGFAKALSATLWIGLALMWLESSRVKLDALRLLILPLGILALALPLFFPGADFSAWTGQPLFVPHLVVGTLAYGVLTLAALHALLMTAVQRDLHRVTREQPSFARRWIDGLPPLMVLERMLFRFIWVGFVLLLLTTLTGIVFSEEVFGRPLRFEHKTVFSLIALAFFGVLLLGRRVRGWRGRIALRFTLGGFSLLMLAYVGTRFVLEVVLQRF